MLTEEIEQDNRLDRHRAVSSQSPYSGEQDLQAYLLQGVSRTFALTIPQLPRELAWVVTNAYLLCRIIDTIEDEPALSPARKQDFCQQFVAVVAGETPAERFAAELAPHLSDHTLPTEHELIQNTPYVIGITRTLNSQQQEALQCCVKLMAEGMAEFQRNSNPNGLRDLVELDRYCYYVAGVVGEMLTKLFCDYSPAIAKHREALMKLAVSFGQGLQMTNILKDIWDDRHRGACWLPQDVFSAVGFDLRELAPGRYRDSFGQGLVRLIGIAHHHLKDALTYTLLIPRQETGIRNFCLLAIGLAVLTLRKINRHRDFSVSSTVKISRRSVKATLLTSHFTVAHDYLLKSLFQLAALGLPNGS
jgi:farnesyl-diphosphate farnesyltransferase